LAFDNQGYDCFLKAHLGYSGEQWKNLLAKTTVAAINDPKCDHVGLAWMLACGDVVGDYAWHNGQTLGQKSMAVCCPNQDTAIVMLSNKAPRLWHNFLSPTAHREAETAKAHRG